MRLLRFLLIIAVGFGPPLQLLDDDVPRGPQCVADKSINQSINECQNLHLYGTSSTGSKSHRVSADFNCSPMMMLMDMTVLMMMMVIVGHDNDDNYSIINYAGVVPRLLRAGTYHYKATGPVNSTPGITELLIIIYSSVTRG